MNKINYNLGKATDIFLTVMGYLIPILGIGVIVAASIAHFFFNAC